MSIWVQMLLARLSALELMSIPKLASLEPDHHKSALHHTDNLVDIWKILKLLLQLMYFANSILFDASSYISAVYCVRSLVPSSTHHFFFVNFGNCIILSYDIILNNFQVLKLVFYVSQLLIEILMKP